MSETENTNAIDEKKTEETNNGSPDYKAFIKNYMSSIIFTIGFSVFIIGGLGLYTTKVAQANILPDNVELAPYTVYDRVVKDIPIDINIMRPSFLSENVETVSQKAIFNSQEYLDSFRNSFLCSLKKKADPNGGLFANAPLYFSNVYDNVVAVNFLMISTIFFYLSYLPESMIMLVYGLLGIFIWIGLYFMNLFISIFYHFVSIPQLFRSGQENMNQWEDKENISFFRISKLLLFWFVWIPIGLLSTFIVPIFFTLYGLISPLFATYTINKTNKTKGVFNFIKDTFAYKKFFFFVLATISLFSNGNKYLGSSALIGIAIAVAFAYFIGLYSNDIPQQGVDNFTSKIRQSVKQSSIEDIDTASPKLVEICKPIPVADNNVENGVYREVKKPMQEDDVEMQIQSGGKKQINIKPSKKYNIRLV
jgi:hypothetical protein